MKKILKKKVGRLEGKVDGLVTTIDNLAIAVGKGFQEVDTKIGELRTEMDTRFDRVEATMDHGFMEMKNRLWQVESSRFFNNN